MSVQLPEEPRLQPPELLRSRNRPSIEVESRRLVSVRVQLWKANTVYEVCEAPDHPRLRHVLTTVTANGNAGPPFAGAGCEPNHCSSRSGQELLVASMGFSSLPCGERRHAGRRPCQSRQRRGTMWWCRTCGGWCGGKTRHRVEPLRAAASVSEWDAHRILGTPAGAWALVVV